MSIIEDVVKGVASPLTTPFEIVKDIVGKFSSGKDKLDAEIALAQLQDEKEKREAQLLQAQIDLNKIEAQSGSFWNSGWRPSIGWTGSVCLALAYIPQYIIGTIMWVIVFCKTGNITPYPVNSSDLLQLILVMLGMGTLRTFEKINKSSK